MKSLYIYLALLFPTFTVMAEPVIVQRVEVTADIIINPSHTVSVYMSNTSNKLIEQKNIGSIVTLSVDSLNVSQQSYLVFPIGNEIYPRNCTHSMGKLNSSNRIHYCLDGDTDRDVIYTNNRIYHSVPTNKDFYISALYSKKNIP
ncbi:TPA: hypothetical protein AB5E10_003208, partial [Vibrio cholerae]